MTLPTSWPTKGKKLGDWTTVQGGMIPGEKVIYWNEVTPDISARNLRLSRDVGSAATMEFYTNTDAITDSTLMTILTRSILGGWDTVTSQKLIPFKHPFFPSLHAKDIVNQQDMGNSETLGLYGSYSVTKLTVSFESLPYGVDLDYNPDSDDYNPNWLVTPFKGTNNRIGLPIGLYRYTAAAPVPFDSKPCMLGNYFVQAMNYFTVKFMEVPASLLIEEGLMPTVSGFGLVNDRDFAGCDAGTLLIDNVDSDQYSDWTGNFMYIVNAYIIYNGDGWNTQRTPAGTVADIEYIVPDPATGTRKRPFRSFDFRTFFDNLNPR